MPLHRGDVVLVPFPYSDLRGMKRRPACVVSADQYHDGPDVIGAMITSQASRRTSPGLGDVVLAQWRDAGLRAASTLRAARLLVIERRLVDTTIGRLPLEPLHQVDQALREVFALS